MFRRILHHLQEELTFSLHKRYDLTKLLSLLHWLHRNTSIKNTILMVYCIPSQCTIVCNTVHYYMPSQCIYMQHSALIYTITSHYYIPSQCIYMQHSALIYTITSHYYIPSQCTYMQYSALIYTITSH